MRRIEHSSGYCVNHAVVVAYAYIFFGLHAFLDSFVGDIRGFSAKAMAIAGFDMVFSSHM